VILPSRGVGSEGDGGSGTAPARGAGGADVWLTRGPI
jgi:hypothetical protein